MKSRRFKDGYLNDLKERIDIIDVVNRYCEVVKKGGRFWARCPFHFEKTPSFCIYHEEGVYKCFGCGESGDVISFVQKMDNLDFMGAVEKLADMVNFPIAYADDKESINYAKQLKDKKIMLNILSDSADFYQNRLYQDDAVLAQQYIKKRKINKQSLDNFGIGYSPNFDALRNYLKGKYEENLLIEAGVLNQSNGKIYDTQAERLVFPIKNQLGQVVGFSGRILTDNKELAKYKNTKATPIFDKSKLIFGLFQAIKSRAIEQKNYILLVEGQIDVIMLHQNGFNNAVASLGTAFTEGHANQLKRVNQNIVICYDGDEAGQKATAKAADILYEHGFKVKVAELPSGNDPDEYIKNFGSDGFEQLISSAEEIFDYKLRKWAENMNISSNFDKTEYINKAINLIASLPTIAESELYLPIIKKYTNVSIDSLREALSLKKNSFIKNDNKQSKDEVVLENLFDDAYQKADKFIIASLLYKKEYVSEANIENLEFTNPIYQAIYQKIIEFKQKKLLYKISNLYDDYDVEENKTVKDLIFFNFSEDEDINKKYFNESILQNEVVKLKKMSDKIEIDYNECKDINERSNLAKKLMNIKFRLKQIGQK